MTTSQNPLQIAIDGPVASGKGEVAARLAQKLGFLYVYTGAMYRALAVACIQNGVSLSDAQGVMDVLQRISIDMTVPAKGSEFPYAVLLNGVDVTERIQSPDAAAGASDVGTISSVRTWMVERQKKLAHGRNVVMEGRDIALRVLPNAQLKIFLTASLEERARRRYLQLVRKGIAKTLAETVEETKMRDRQDGTRSTDPLQKVTGAWELDSTLMTVDETVDAVIKELKKRGLL